MAELNSPLIYLIKFACDPISHSVRTLPSDISPLTSFARAGDLNISWSKVTVKFLPLLCPIDKFALKWVNAAGEFSKIPSRGAFIDVQNPKMTAAIGACVVDHLQ